ncbi:hypothetical protein GCM10010421_07920 [Streptomyces glaucus]|uniref:Secreted protein n=1 Tax=Streptomyces glaucus TaxID=284029 RepID=A0ABN3J7N1_9ACTN
MQGTAAGPTSAGWTANAVPDAPATSASAASNAVLLRLMSAVFLFLSVEGARGGWRGPVPYGVGARRRRQGRGVRVVPAKAAFARASGRAGPCRRLKDVNAGGVA